MKLLVLLVVLGAHCLDLLAQEQPRRKPVLIRDVEPDGSPDAPLVLDPLRAEKSLKIGDFYLKKKNYAAAIKRYREAIGHRPRWPKPYEKLVVTFEKLGDFPQALETCQLFLDVNPNSEKVGEFRRLYQKLQKKNPLKSSTVRKN